MRLTIREAVRGVVVTPRGELLLMLYQLPRLALWITPGGGIGPGETPGSALRRELLEETAIDCDRIGPHLWTRVVRLSAGGCVFEQRERFFLVETHRFTPRFLAVPGDVERSCFRAFRWWETEDIAASEDLFAPRRVDLLLADLLRAGPPKRPIDLDA